MAEKQREMTAKQLADMFYDTLKQPGAKGDESRQFASELEKSHPNGLNDREFARAFMAKYNASGDASFKITDMEKTATPPATATTPDSKAKAAVTPADQAKAPITPESQAKADVAKVKGFMTAPLLGEKGPLGSKSLETTVKWNEDQARKLTKWDGPGGWFGNKEHSMGQLLGAQAQVTAGVLGGLAEYGVHISSPANLGYALVGLGLGKIKRAPKFMSLMRMVASGALTADAIMDLTKEFPEAAKALESGDAVGFGHAVGQGFADLVVSEKAGEEIVKGGKVLGKAALNKVSDIGGGIKKGVGGVWDYLTSEKATAPPPEARPTAAPTPAPTAAPTPQAAAPAAQTTQRSREFVGRMGNQRQPAAAPVAAPTPAPAPQAAAPQPENLHARVAASKPKPAAAPAMSNVEHNVTEQPAAAQPVVQKPQPAAPAPTPAAAAPVPARPVTKTPQPAAPTPEPTASAKPAAAAPTPEAGGDRAQKIQAIIKARAQIIANGLKDQRSRDILKQLDRQLTPLVEQMKSEAPPAARPATASPSGTSGATLPHDLRGAKPRYSYGDKAYELEFPNDLDRAAYITAQSTPSKRDAQYLKFAMEATDASADAIRQYGRDIRASIKNQVKGGAPTGEPLAVDTSSLKPPKGEKTPRAGSQPAPTTPPQKSTPQRQQAEIAPVPPKIVPAENLHPGNTYHVLDTDPELGLYKGEQLVYRGTSRGKHSFTAIDPETGTRTPMEIDDSAPQSQLLKVLGEPESSIGVKTGPRTKGRERGSFPLRGKTKAQKLAAAIEGPKTERTSQATREGRGSWISPEGEVTDLGEHGMHQDIAARHTGKKNAKAAVEGMMGEGWVRVRGGNVEAAETAAESPGFLTAVHQAAENAQGSPIHVQLGGRHVFLDQASVGDFSANPLAYMRRMMAPPPAAR